MSTKIFILVHNQVLEKRVVSFRFFDTGSQHAADCNDGVKPPESAYIELFSPAVSTMFCVAGRLTAGWRSDSLSPVTELGNCACVTTESESIPHCPAQADFLFTY